MAQFWKKHVCVGCGSAYRYRFGGRYKTRAGKHNTSDMRPCPTCGLCQPDMVGTRRLRMHLLFGVIGSLGAAFLAAVGTGRELSERETMWASVLVGVVTLVAQLVVALWNPNRNPEANRRRAKQLLRSNDMELVRDETRDEAALRLPRWGFGPVQALAVAGMAVATVLFVSHECVRGLFGWPTNPQWRPGVLGPGDESRVYLPGMTSIKGLWRGQASAEVLNAAELGLPEARLWARTHDGSWAGTIYAKSNESQQPFTAYADVRLPDSPHLAGKTLKVRVDVMTTYPVLHGDHYDDEQTSLNRTFLVELADRPGAGRLYAVVWHGGGFVGAGLLLLMSLALAVSAWSMRRHAFPMKVVQERDEEEDDDDDEEFGRRRRRRRRDE